jgi:N-acetylmuramoyl-L-alanine amidase
MSRQRCPDFGKAPSVCAGVLLECGFLTNPDEAKRLSKEDYRQQLAEALAAGIVTYHSLASKSEFESAKNEAVSEMTGVSLHS